MGRKYGLGKYGRGTYDLGGGIPPWVPIPVVPGEIWVPEVVAPPSSWVPSNGTGSGIWAPVVHADSCWGVGGALNTTEIWSPVAMPVMSDG